MKFQSNFEGYRNDLAKDLKEKRGESREDAQVFLAAEKETDEYKLAKELKKEINNPKLESFDRQHDSIYFEKIDIANQIPEELKIYLDKIKLIALDESQEEWIYKNTDNSQSSDYVGKKGKLFNENLQKIAIDLLNKLTGGDFGSPKILNHVIGGFKKYSGDGESWNFEDIKSQIIQRRIGGNSRIGGAFFSAGQSHYWTPDQALLLIDPGRASFKEKMQNVIGEQAPGIGSDGSHRYVNEPRSMQTVDSEIGIRPEWTLDGKRGGIRRMTKDEKLKALEMIMRWDYAKHDSGVEITFNKDTSWEDIAKWMVDLPNYTLYKLKDEYLEKQ
jgi:hypothetical protein